MEVLNFSTLSLHFIFFFISFIVSHHQHIAYITSFFYLYIYLYLYLYKGVYTRWMSNTYFHLANLWCKNNHASELRITFSQKNYGFSQLYVVQPQHLHSMWDFNSHLRCHIISPSRIRLSTSVIQHYDSLSLPPTKLNKSSDTTLEPWRGVSLVWIITLC